MTALIIEDDPDSQDVLKLLLEQQFPFIRVAAICASVQEGIKAIQVRQPELIFLDIALPDGTGFDLLREVGAGPFDIIFVSAHDHFAARAFRWSAVDYLVKPVTASLLREALEKVAARKQLPGASQQIRLLLENINSIQRAKPLAKLALATANDIEFVNIGDVIRVEGEKNYSTFFLNDKRRITVSRSLGEYEKMLEDTTLMRIQKSHIVNLVYVKKFVKSDGGWVMTADGAELPVSNLKREILLTRLTEGLDK